MDLATLPGNEDLSAFQLAERKKRTVFVGNIPITLPAKKLWYVFKHCGKIEKIWFRSLPPSTMITDRRNVVKGSMIGGQKNNKNAYILFAEEASIEGALKLNNHAVDNPDFNEIFHLRVDRDEKKQDDFTSTIFVGNLPFIVNEEELRRHFEDLGTITNIRIVRDPKTLIGCGIAFVQFSTKEEAIEAVNTCAKHLRFGKFKGRGLRVKKAVPNERREKKQDKKRDKKSQRKQKRFQPADEFTERFLSSSDKRKTNKDSNFHNDIKMKKDKKSRMMNEMIRSGGRSKIRNGSRKFITNKIDWQGKFKDRREKRKTVNTANMKKTMKKSDM